MNNVKFRVWDRTKEEMYEVKGFVDGNPYIDFHYDDESNEYCIQDVHIVKDGKLMQYTGIEDNNGMEVCDGDIVRYSHHAVGIIVREVRMKYGMWGIEGNVEGTQIPFANILESEFEVIGNVCKNKELLERE